MKNLEQVQYWKPLSYFGLTNSFFDIDPEIVVHTWILIAMMCVLLFLVQRELPKQHSIGRFITISGVKGFAQLCTETLGIFSFQHFCFVASIFTFILACNTLALFPFLIEPTKDLNTTFALGLIAFFYTQTYAIKEHGIIGYIKEYFTPFVVMMPLHVVSKLSSVMSLSFRLFGNILAGATIMHVWFGAIDGSIILETVGIISGLNLVIALFFGIFEGVLQAFIFSMLTLTYLSIALQGEDHESDEVMP